MKRSITRWQQYCTTLVADDERILLIIEFVMINRKFIEWRSDFNI